MAEAETPKSKSVNVNIGILGHIDSGKTSLCRVLSTITSTASLDKHPQSQERGITLDLGFSSFSSEAPESFKTAGFDTIQFCLVDCPGHASLIRTVIGGAQIIDMCALVIDVNKGIQAQTAECLVVAEILANQMIVILNKVDMIPEAKRAKALKSVIKMLQGTFARTKFGADLPFACVAANPQDGSPSIGVTELIEAIKSKLVLPQRNKDGPFMFSYDHAFSIRGQGTVLTGTVLSGAVKPAMNIVVPQLGEAGKGKKVRSLQMFRQPVQEAIQGDRVAMCVAALDHKELERGIVLGEKFPVPTLDACICVVSKLSYYKHEVKTKAKFHITLGHQTVMANAYFFCPYEGTDASSSSSKTVTQVTTTATGNPQGKGGGGYKAAKEGTNAVSLSMGMGALTADRQRNWPTSFDLSLTYLHLDDLFESGAPVDYENSDGDTVRISPGKKPGALEFYLNSDFKGEVTELRYDPSSGRLAMQDDVPLATSVESRGAIHLKDRDRVLYLLGDLAEKNMVPGLPLRDSDPLSFALLVLEKPVMCPLGSLLIGSKLDFDTNSPNCRMAFFGRILAPINPKDLAALRLVKMKSKSGFLHRVDRQEPTLLICRDMFKADTDMNLFTGLKVIHENSGEQGILEGCYGTEGLFKVQFKRALHIQTDDDLNVVGDERITLMFKKYDFDEKSRKIVQ
eukprot:TRINITY_DN54460_c0_g1_i1.p1 TRINITY_DN54460_c0_g1~~TRINITY_DN54460_c0_g1_i1.p1  ORF type:complete len:683 (+),score=118.02 TRINITY_DN54460_c0_g1_i1:95-2143(+)